MSAFDTGTNTASASFTNSYGTVQLLPSGSQQEALGFARNTGKLYFEFKVDEAGGDPSKLVCGFKAVGPPSAPFYPLSISVSTGDVIGFAINCSGDSQDPITSITVGFTPAFVIRANHNGTWLSYQSVYATTGPWAAGFVPWTNRAATSTSAAMVSLRVLSVSQSYAPSGYSEWGNSGGVTVSSNTATGETWGWDPATKVGFSLSGSNYYAVIGSITVGDIVLSNNVLPVRNSAWEVLAPYQATSGRLLRIGVKRAAAYSFSDTSGIFRFGTGGHTAVCRASGSATGTLFAFNATDMTTVQAKLWGFTRNASVGHIWGMQGFTTGLSFGTVPDFSGVGGNPLFSVSATSSLWVFLDESNTGGGGSLTTRSYIFNPGGLRGFFWPMVPEYESLDRSRRVIGGEVYWQLPAAVTSLTVVNEVIVSTRAQQIARVSANTFTASGKLYFEVNLGSSTGPGGTEGVAWIGLSRNGGASYTQTGVGAIDQIFALGVGSAAPTIRKIQDGVTLSFTITVANVTGYAFKALVAVDFDAGMVWFGRGGETALWGTDGDPAAGTNPALTFTANTPLYPCVAIASPSVSTSDVYMIAAFEADAQRFAPPTGFVAWTDPSPITTTTATSTPSGGTVGLVTWPFGVLP